MPQPRKRICFEPCEKVVFDARNARIIPPVGKKAGCPDLTDADKTNIQRDIEAQFKGEIVTIACGHNDCECRYGPQPAWPNVYETIDIEWEVERGKGRDKCTYRFDAQVDTAYVTVSGRCSRKPGLPKIKGKTVLPG